MAEAMLLGVAKSVLGQLGSPALNEILLIWNCKKDIKRLGETIETITCVIQDAEQRQSGDRAVKLWLSRLREVLYDADDLFDTIAAKALHKKSIRGSAFKKEGSLWVNDIPWHLLTSLRILNLYGELNTIPDGIQQLTSLQSLYVPNSHDIKEIPKWIINLTSLQKLGMNDCSTELAARCDPENGIDWHLISRIPSVMINWRWLRND